MYRSIVAHDEYFNAFICVYPLAPDMCCRCRRVMRVCCVLLLLPPQTKSGRPYTHGRDASRLRMIQCGVNVGPKAQMASHSSPVVGYAVQNAFGNAGGFCLIRLDHVAVDKASPVSAPTAQIDVEDDGIGAAAAALAPTDVEIFVGGGAPGQAKVRVAGAPMDVQQTLAKGGPRQLDKCLAEHAKVRIQTPLVAPSPAAGFSDKGAEQPVARYQNGTVPPRHVVAYMVHQFEGKHVVDNTRFKYNIRQTFNSGRVRAIIVWVAPDCRDTFSDGAPCNKSTIRRARLRPTSLSKNTPFFPHYTCLNRREMMPF